MKSFVKKILLFSALFICFFICLFSILNYYNNYALQRFRVKSGVKTIFIGDSHVRLAINDNLIPNTMNLSQLSESYKFSYLKLQTILKMNPAIKKVYVGFSYNNLSSGYDDVIFGKDSRDILGNYFFLFPLKEKIGLLKLHRDEIFQFIRIILFNGTKNLVLNEKNITFLGRYENEFNNVAAAKSSMDKRLLFQFYQDGQTRDFSSTNIYYLKKIIDLCRFYHTEVNLLNTPLHPYYQRKIPLKFIEKYSALIRENNWKLLDLHDVSLDDSCFIPDGDHISIKGAAIFAAELNNLLNK